LINADGLTENTTFTATFEIREEAIADIPIGRPIANTTVHILSPLLEPVPVGVPGELYAGGDGLARGYLNDPELTAAKFIADPFHPGERLYRTGDLACWCDDSMIGYIGRIDDQVKIRGYRIEPGDIEARLLRDRRLKQAVVVARADVAGEPRLVAYYTARQPVTGEELQSHLRRRLPEYMIPAHFVQLELEQLPLTGNGKVDRAALPAPVQSAIGSGGAAQRPRTSTEAELIGIWRTVRSHSDVDIDSNFFDLGGHSLRAVKLIYKNSVCCCLTVIFEAPTVAGLAGRIVDAAQFGQDSIDRPLVKLGAQSGQPALFAFPAGNRRVGLWRACESPAGSRVPRVQFH
jgi:hypothetical protein